MKEKKSKKKKKKKKKKTEALLNLWVTVTFFSFNDTYF